MHIVGALVLIFLSQQVQSCDSECERAVCIILVCCLSFGLLGRTLVATVEIWDLLNLLCPMKTFFPSESCKETHLKSINPQSWLQVERGKLAKFSSESASSM